MVNLTFENYSNVEIRISIPEDAHIDEAFEGLYRAWLAAGYLEEQFDAVCEKYVKQGEMMFI